MIAERIRPLRTHLSALIRHDNLILAILAVGVGVAVGWAAVGFRTAFDMIQSVFYGSGGEDLATIAAALPRWQVVVAPVVGGLLVGLFYRYLMPGRTPQGPAQVIEASALHGGRLPLWPGLAATIGSAASIGAGASVGKEGPVVLLGATLSSWFSQRIGFGRAATRILLGCGGAAAVAASFNAPIAGALFAHEVIVGHYALSAFAPVVMASIAATMVSRSVYGDYPAFNIPVLEAVDWIEFPAFALTGAACGLAAVIMMHGVGLVRRTANRYRLPEVLRPALAGLLIGLIALELPDILGVGYEQTDRALRNLYPIATVFALIAAKLVATAFCLGMGFGGGVFSPALAIGALVGIAVGTAATMVGQELSSGPAAYALVGMGSMAAAVLGAPISTTLIIFELTGDYTLTIAAMAGVVIATLVSTQLFGFKSFFLAQLRESCIVLDGGQDVSGLKGTTVSDVLSPVAGTCRPQSTRAEARALLLQSNAEDIFVVDDDGIFVGVVSGTDLVGQDDDSDTVENLVYDAQSVVLARDTIEHAVRAILAAKTNRLPVIDNTEDGYLVGAVTAQDLLRAVNLALISAEAEKKGNVKARPAGR